MNKQNITKNIKSPDNKKILKKHFSHCFDKNGDFDFNKLKKELSQNEEINFSKESYGMDWLGKSYARLLASDEATTLLKEDQEFNKKEENKNSQNLLLKGDNLEILKHLSNAYHEKVKMIYIDPPYNTGSDGFVYQDDRKFNIEELSKLAGIDEEKAERILDFTASKSNSHSAWLTFMYPRLYIAKQLLKDDGVIFVSIDDNEVAQLRLLMDEIFGEENFVGELIWRKKTGASDAKGFATITENILVYVKSINILEDIFSKNKQSFDPTRYKLIDEYQNKRGNHYIDNLDRGGIQYSDSMNYGIECPDSSITYPNGRTEFVNDGWIWTWGKQKLKWGIEKGFIVFKKSKTKKSKWGVYYKNYMFVNNKDEIIEKSAPHKNIIFDIINTEGTAEINELFITKVFQYPKPSRLIKTLLSYIKLNSNDLILDFFAGSGTTGDAVMQLNAEDGGNRKFILAQIPEPIDKKKNKTAYDFVKDELKKETPVISDITQERIIRSAKKIIKDNKESKEPKDLSKQDFGFKVFETISNDEGVWEDYHLEAEEFNSQEKLFDENNLKAEDIKTLLTTWKTFDNIPLTQNLAEINLVGYKGYYFGTKLYLMNKGFETKNLKKLLEEIDENENFNPASIIVSAYNFESKVLREIAENIKSYANKKQIDIDFITRY